MKMNILIIFIIIFSLLFTINNAFAAGPTVPDPTGGGTASSLLGVRGVPLMMNIQGRALNDAGDALSGAQTMVFKIYYITTLVWSQRQDVDIPASDRGVFNVLIGGDDDSGRGFPEFLTDEYFLEIVLNGTALTPRQKLVAVPYAITARNLEGGGIKVGADRKITGSGGGFLPDEPFASNAVTLGLGYSDWDVFIDDDLYVKKKLRVDSLQMTAGSETATLVAEQTGWGYAGTRLYTATATVTVNKKVGTITIVPADTSGLFEPYTLSGATVRVNNSYISDTSQLFVTPIAFSEMTVSQSDGYFTLNVPNTAVKVHFWVN
ncbi:MAG: hypothetical protein JW782_01120 [Candidatus Saganbacteria bacterium]|nr:hypothetical protein [Candidatus Saganbacteria bacterium]